jgi:hypothetical protein
VDLADGDRGSIGAAGNSFGEKAAVQEDVFAVIVGRKAQIQLSGNAFRSVGAGNAAYPGAETVPEPGDIFPIWDQDQGNAVGCDIGIGRRRAWGVEGGLHPVQFSGKGV